MILTNSIQAQQVFAPNVHINTTNSENNQSRVDLQANPDFTFFNETSNLPTYWVDRQGNCQRYFSCTVKFTDGWNDYVSFSVSTTNNTNRTWSWIYGKEIGVMPNQRIQFISHMKLNNWTSQSHIVLEGFNETANKWYQIIQCPSGAKGPLEWREFSCIVSIPANTIKIRSILNAGWSSKFGHEATTWFDSVNILTNIYASTLSR